MALAVKSELVAPVTRDCSLRETNVGPKVKNGSSLVPVSVMLTSCDVVPPTLSRMSTVKVSVSVCPAARNFSAASETVKV